MKALRVLASTLALLGPLSAAYAQVVPLQAGPWTTGHVPQYWDNSNTQPTFGDGGGAAGGGLGTNPFELGLTEVSPTATYPAINAGSGPNYSNFCTYDGPTTGPYHYLCLSPNDNSTGVISYGAGGGASNQSLYFNINGVSTLVGNTSLVIGTSPITGSPSTGVLTNNSGVLGAYGSLPTSLGGTGLTALGTANQCLTTNSGATAMAWAACSSATNLTIGSTTITSGTSGNFEYNNGGVLGEKTPGTGVATAFGNAVNGSGGFLTYGATSAPSLATVGTIGTGAWNGTAIGYQYGGTGLTALGTSNQCLTTNSGATAMTWASCASGATITGTPSTGQLTDWASSSSVQGITTGTGVVTAIGNNVNGSGGLLTYGATAAPSLATVGTIGTGTWQGSLIGLAYGGTNANLTASNGGIVYSTASALGILSGTSTSGQCLLSGSNAAPTWGSCTGAAAVSSVSNSDGTLTISPTTGAVVGSLALGHANTWTATQTFPSASIALTELATGALGTGITVNSGNWSGTQLAIGNGGTGLTSLGTGVQTSLGQATNGTNSASLATYAETALPSLATVGTIGTGVWQGSVIGYLYGGTGLNSLGSAGQCLTTNGAGTAMVWAACSSSTTLTIGSTSISGGTNGNFEFNNGGVLGETTPGSGVATAFTTNTNSSNGIATVNGSISTGNCVKWGPGVTDSGVVCNAPSPSKRQTVAGGPITSAGLANFLPSTSGSLTLTAQNVTSSAPLVVLAAQGTGSTGQVDDVYQFTSNPSWTLPASSSGYLWINASTGATGYTTVAPVYKYSVTPSTSSGAFTFLTSTMIGYYGNGSSAPATPIVIVGEFTTGSSTVTATVAYSYNGYYDSGLTATLPGSATQVSFTTNIGVTDLDYQFYIQCTTANNGFSIGDIIPIVGVYSGNTMYMTKNTAGFTTATATTPFETIPKGGGSGVGLTAADWSYRAVVKRIW